VNLLDLLFYGILSPMKKIAYFLIGLILLVGIFWGGKFILERKGGDKGGLKVTSIPQASVFLEADNLGRTPFESDKIKSGDYTLKLVPEDAETAVSSWQGKIKVSTNVLTYVNRELTDSDLTSAGEVLSLEKIPGKSSEIAITATPEGAKISLDGEEKGAAPLILKNISAGDHEISLSASGFIERSIKIRTSRGYKLIADFQLALIPGEEGKTGKKEGQEEGPAKPYVKILDTPTGWLRVREEPSTAATEAAKVNPGETYPLLEEKEGWFKIEYETGKEGWISGKYAEKVE